MAANFFDQFDPATAKPEGGGKGGNYFDQFDASTADTPPSGGTASDLAKSLKVGVQRLPGVATGLADLPIALATGARPFTQAADALGAATGFQPGKWADETKFSAGYEQGKKAVDEAWKDGSAGDIALAYLKNPGYTANTVAESVPGMLAGGLAARALLGAGRVAGVAAKAGGVGPAAPGLAERALGQWAAPVAAGVGEGAVTAGQQMAQYQGDDQQKNALASLGAGAITGGLGVGAGRAANKLGLETAETAIAKAGTGATTEVPLSAKRRVLGGMVSEAVLQELPQSAQEQMWQNYADGKPLMEGVARAATEGAIAGGVMGAGANVRGRPVATQDPGVSPAEDSAAAPLQLGHSPDPLIVFPDGTTGRRADVDAYLASLPEDQQQAERARLYGYAPQQADIGTSPGAADPNAPQRTTAEAPLALDATTAPGAAPQHGNGVDFTRDVDTGGLSLVDPAEQERARAATIDYQPGDTTPQWDTAPGAAPQRSGLDMPAREFDTGGLAVDTRTPSQRMGIDPSSGPLSRGAAQAVDSAPQAMAPAAQEIANAQAASARPAGQAQATPIPATRSSAMEATGSATLTSTTEGAIREPQATQAQQAIPQAAPAGAAPIADPAQRGAGTQAAARTPAPGALTDGAPSANHGTQAAPKAAPQGQAEAAALAAEVAARPSNWRTSMLGAVPVAKGLGIDTRGKRTAQVVAEIDAADAQRAGVAQVPAAVSLKDELGEGVGTYSDKLNARIKDANYKLMQASSQSPLQRMLSGHDVDAMSAEVLRLESKREEAKTLDAAATRGSIDRGMLKSARQELDASNFTPEQRFEAVQRAGRAGNAADASQAIFDAVDGGAPITTMADSAAQGETNATPRDLRLADERGPGAASAAQAGPGEQAGRATDAQPDALRPAGRGDPATAVAGVQPAVPGRGGPGQPASGVADGRRGEPAMSQELARALLAIRKPREQATKDTVRAAVSELVNGMGMLPNRLGRVVVATADEIKQDWEPLIGPTGMEASGESGQAQGFYDPNTKTVFLISDHIRKGDELGVVAHELMHKHGQAVLGADGWNQLHGAIGAWANAPEGSLERRVYDEAAARVQASGPELSTQELFPYAVQVALEMGVRPNGLAPQGSVARWLAQVRSMLRQVWNKIAGQKGDFNSLDLVNLAFGIAQRENPANAGELDAATQGKAARAESALKQISDAEDLFALPKSNANTVEGIVADHDPDIKVQRTELPGNETMYTLTMPDGTRAAITSREPTKDEVFGMNDSTGRWITERPGENAPPVGSRSDVWIDVSRLNSGQNGARVYNIASTFAHNTGRIFIGDPSGLSDVALRRRAEQMLSSALKFGTTDHIAPHPRQLVGDMELGVPPLRWVYGDHEGNAQRLIDVNQRALENVYPEAKNLLYDLDTGAFRDASTGEILNRQQMAQAVARGRGDAEREAGAGWRTVARSAVFRALLRRGGQGRAGAGELRRAEPGPGRSAVVDGAVRERDQPDPPAYRNGRGDGGVLAGLAAQRENLVAPANQKNERIFYSRSVAAAPTTGDYTPAQARAAERVFGVQQKPTLSDRAKEIRANLGTKLRQGLVDQFAPIKEVSEKAYILARLSKGSDGAVEAALLYGKPYLRDGVADVDIKDGGFAKVLASLKGEDVRFFQWVAAQRAERLKAEGKENLLTDQDITALKSLNAGRFADGTPRMPAYAAALRELNTFNEASLKVAMESGLIDQAAYDLMKDQPYVPFYRIMEEEGGMRGPRFSSGLVNQQAWKKLKGGTQQLNADLLQNTLMNWSHLYAAAARNRASLETMAAAEKMGIAYQVPADTKGAVKVMRDGVAEHWAVEDPYLLDAISAMSYAPPGIVKAMAPFKRLLTFGVTVNPTFKIRNLIRDSLSAIAQSDLSYNPAENVANGWKATSKESQTYASMLASGGIIKFGTQENTDRVRAQIEKLGGEMLDKSGFDRLKGQMKSLWEAYEEFGDRTENVNRAALYERLIAKGHSHAEAAFMARDLMDFSMSGKWETVRFLAQTVPFLNARLQGLYKLGRAAKEDPRRFATMAGAVSLASLGLLAAYGDDDDWKKREDWDRDNFWWFKIGDKAFRVPKPFEVGAIGTVAERTAELMLDKEMTGKRFGQRISDMVFNTFAMDPTPQFIKPLLDVYANKDSFSGRAIEGMADEKLRPQDRYNERTSEIARLLGSWGLPDPVRLAKGEYSGLSPKQIDFLLRGYFGWLATVATTATDTIARPALDRGERPAMRLRDTFLAGNFVESLPSGSSRYVTTMHEQAKEVEQAWASYQAALKSGDLEKAREIQQDEAPKLRSRLAVANAKQQIAELGQQAKKIEGNRLLSADAKRERLDEIEARKSAIAQRVAVMN